MTGPADLTGSARVNRAEDEQVNRRTSAVERPRSTSPQQKFSGSVVRRLAPARQLIARLPVKIIAFFVLVLLLMAPYITAPPFFVDELDNLLGARTVAAGGVVYRDYYSQHTPLMYYVLGVFARLGVSSVAGFRICFYTIIAAFFMMVYYRYRAAVGARTLLMLPVLFIFDIARHAQMGNILSDMVQAMGLLVLYLEFFDYSIRKPLRLSRSSSVVIALAIFFAAGVALMSVYAIAVIFLGVVLVEIERGRASRKNERWHARLIRSSVEVARRYALVTASLATLALLYVGYFTVNHALRAMVYQSFTFNTEVYSKYSSDAATGAVGSVLDSFTNYANHISGTLSQLSTMSSFTAAVLILANVTTCYLLSEKSKALGIVSALFTVYTGIRGYTGFHSTAYIMFSWFCVAYLIDRFAFNPKRLRAALVSVVVVVLSVMPSWGTTVKGLHGPAGLAHIFDKKPDYYVQKYVPAGGYAYPASLDSSIFFNNDVRPPSRMGGGLVPWFAEAFMPDLIADLEKNRPNVVIYNPGDDVWGHKYSEFSKPLEALLARDYVYYPYSDAVATYFDAESSRIWIRKGMGVNALYSGVVYDPVPSGAALEPAGPITGGSDVLQTFDLAASDVSGVAVDFGTYARTNTSRLDLEFGRYDPDSNTESPLVTRSIDASRLNDNAMGYVNFVQTLNLSAGDYYVRLTTDDATPGNAVTVWLAKGKGAGTRNRLFVGGVEQDAQLNFKLLK